MFINETRTYNETLASEQLHTMDETVVTLLETAENEVLTLSENALLQYESDDDFTNFIGADPDTFEYAITAEEQEIIDLFATYRANHYYMNSVYFGTVNGAFVRSHKRAASTDYDPRVRVWYQLGEANPDSVQLTDPYKSVTTDDINLGTVKAVVNEDGELLGVVGADITLHALSEITTEFEGYDHPYNIIISDKNIILSHPNPEYLFQDASVLGFELPDENTSNNQLFKIEELGITKSVYTYVSEDTGWSYYKIVPMSVINANTVKLILYSALLVAILLVIIFLSNIKVSRTFSNRIKTIITAMEKVDNQVEDIMITDSANDELSIISSEFNRMIKRIDEAQYRLKYIDGETGLQNNRKLLKMLKLRSYDGFLVQVTITNLPLLSQIYGSSHATKLVREITKLLEPYIDEDTELIRSSTTSFVFLFKYLDDRNRVLNIVRLFHKVLSREFYMDDLQVYLEYKMGCVSLIDNELPASEILVNLNLTTMSHNITETEIQFYDIEKKNTLLLELQIQKEMHKALERNEFFTVFQPIVNADNGEIFGFEALARLDNQELGLVRPDVFIPIAEKNRSIIGIGRYILRSSLQFANEGKSIAYDPAFTTIIDNYITHAIQIIQAQDARIQTN